MFIFIIVFIFHVYKSESVYTDRNCGLTSVLSVGKKALSDLVFIDLSWKSLAHNHTLLNKTSFTLKCIVACACFNLFKGAMKSILPYTAETTLNFARTVILIVVLKSAIIWIRTRLQLCYQNHEINNTCSIPVNLSLHVIKQRFLTWH